MLVEVLAAAHITHLVQLQSAHCKRNLPDDALWAAAGAAQPFSHILLPAADALGAGTMRNGRAGDTGERTSVCLHLQRSSVSSRRYQHCAVPDCRQSVGQSAVTSRCSGVELACLCARLP
jgi:hypothetical protein